jgi:hypothetical protein
VVAQGARRVNEEGPVRIPKDVLEELEAVRHYTRSEAWTSRPCGTWRWRGTSLPWSCG